MTATNVYCSVTEFKTRAKIIDTTQDAQVALWLEAASRWIDGYSGRKFYSSLETRTFTPETEWQCQVDDLVSVTTLKTDPSGSRVYDVTFASTEFDLLPENSRNLTPAEPYTMVQVAPNASPYFPRLTKGLQIAGVWGYSDQVVATSTLTAGVNTSVTTIPVADGTLFSVGHIIRVDSEDMAVDAISSNNLTVRRAMNGTTAASHLSAAAVSVYAFGAVAEACFLLANRLKQRKDTPLGVSANTLLGQLQVKAPKDDDILSLLEGYRRLL